MHKRRKSAGLILLQIMTVRILILKELEQDLKEIPILSVEHITTGVYDVVLSS